MKRVAKTKHDLVVEVPLIVRVDPIRVEPPLAIVVPIDVEHVRVAVRVGAYSAPSMPPPIERSPGCI